MSASFAKKYSSILSGQDVLHLFDNLVKHYGSVAGAAKECKITRKTYYDWLTTKQYTSLVKSRLKEGKTLDIKNITQSKVLENSLRMQSLQTLDYLVDRMQKSFVEVLFTYLATLYENSVKAGSQEKFKEFADLFNNKALQYSGLIRQNLDLEVSRLMTNLVDYSIKSGYSFEPKNIKLYGYRELDRVVTELLHFIYFEGHGQTPAQLSASIGIDKDSINRYIKMASGQFLEIKDKVQDEIVSTSGTTYAYKGERSTAGTVR